MSAPKELILKLHSIEETLRVRVEVDACKSMAQITGYIEKAWPQLKDEKYRIYYLDDSDELCVLNELSVGDAITLPAKMMRAGDDAVPVLDLFIKKEIDRDLTSPREVNPSARNLARRLTDFDYMNSFDDAWQLVDSMLATGQDLDSVAKHLETRQDRKQKSVDAAPQEPPARGVKRIASEMEKDSSAVQPQVKTSGKVYATTSDGKHEYHIEKRVKSEKEAVDTMVDLLTEMGFVESKDKAKDLVNNLVGSGEDLKRVADHIMSRAIEQENDSPLALRDLDDELKLVEADDTARDFADLLDDFGFVGSRDAARELVGSLMATEQDLGSIADHFMRHARTRSLKGTKKVADAQKKAVGDAVAAEKKTAGQTQPQETTTA
ncbi:hypothetical protein Pmar_PMAR012026 [Perkinsus marinus ATCC 50983]|uniref:Uncharacterized protein n=1 Tax=Perkinsus marinus (strain ATCC 50983 / TXsc) TaxID=423536 RepID=C5LW81_PERM5|nr:hypothetical protein Pmar_PMAR012026 [Perkinsus marinus ATCC 50983]EEQ99018.1 hypothetical protein Pmar_PMAR012026 [Perkinsus marinus ATCC 50983]|eukprot:XP_002766301.1 hypothetical protein Pmar_PMAR012026 [Perkinsus marinus ATCC 50983]